MSRFGQCGFWAIFAMILLEPGPARAADWPQWRGPFFNGSSDASGLPDSLDPAQNQLWSVTLPGPSSSTPIISGDRLFVSTIDAESKKLLAICLDRKDGHLIWKKELGYGFKANDRNNQASPSPVTDGKRVVFFYATGDLVAFDVDGNPLWAHNIQKEHGEFSIEFIYGSSPLLYRDKLYVQVLHRSDDCYFLAFDWPSGKELWKQPRLNNAVAETKESYGTPTPAEINGVSELLIIGGACMTASDPETGREFWRCGGWDVTRRPDGRVVPSVTVADGLAIACPPKGGKIFAIRSGGSGDVTGSAVAWTSKDATTDCCVPLYYRGNLYVLDGDRKTLTCIDPKTGIDKWAGTLGGAQSFCASPTGADGKIYCINEAGSVWVIAADQFKVLSQTSLGNGPVRSTIVVVDAMAVARTGATLRAFGKK